MVPSGWGEGKRNYFNDKGRVMPRRKYEHVCLWCGSSFLSKSKEQKCCSHKCAGLLNYSRGVAPPIGRLKGRHLSDEHKLKLSKAHTGNPSTSPWTDPLRREEMLLVIQKAVSCRGEITEETRRKKSISMMGKNVTNGNSKPNTLLRNSLDAKLWRESVFERDNWTCQSCGVRGGKLHAHHIQHFSECPELRFNVNNGTTLCIACHAMEHTEIGFFKTYRGPTIVEMVRNG